MPEMQTTLDFLRDLRGNNNREWFEANRKRYTDARAAFESLISDLIFRFGSIEDLGGATAKDCMFRINRDVRFSKDKSPYNAHMSAAIASGGRKGEGRSYYLQIQPDNESFIGGGLYMPDSAQLGKIRDDFVDGRRGFRKIINVPKFKEYFGEVQGEALKTTPKGYPKDHPDMDLLRMKQFLATHAMTDSQIALPDLADHILDVCATIKPFVNYFHEVLS